MTRTISNFDDLIDSRDVIARIEELTEARDAFDEEHGATGWQEVHADEAEELAILEALAEEGKSCAPDWEHGETLIRDSYFTEYAQELLEDCGDLPKNLPHYIQIDWEATARNIRMDYTPIEFGDVTYWIR